MNPADPVMPPTLAVLPTANAQLAALYRRLGIAAAMVPVVAVSAGLSKANDVWLVATAIAIAIGGYQMYRVGIMPRNIQRTEALEREAGYTTLPGLWKRSPNVYLLDSSDGSVLRHPEA